MVRRWWRLPKKIEVGRRPMMAAGECRSKMAENRPNSITGRQRARVDNEPNFTMGRQRARVDKEPKFQRVDNGPRPTWVKNKNKKENEPTWAVIRSAH
jgi:hypothetical protein